MLLPGADPFLALNVIRGELIYTEDFTDQARYELYVLRRAGDLLPLKKAPDGSDHGGARPMTAAPIRAEKEIEAEGEKVAYVSIKSIHPKTHSRLAEVELRPVAC